MPFAEKVTVLCLEAAAQAPLNGCNFYEVLKTLYIDLADPPREFFELSRCCPPVLFERTGMLGINRCGWA